MQEYDRCVKRPRGRLEIPYLWTHHRCLTVAKMLESFFPVLPILINIYSLTITWENGVFRSLCGDSLGEIGNRRFRKHRHKP